MVGVSKGCRQIIKRGQIDDHLSNLIVKCHSIVILGNLDIYLLTVTPNYVSSFYLWQIYCALLLSRVICCAHSGYIAFQLVEGGVMFQKYFHHRRILGIGSLHICMQPMNIDDISSLSAFTVIPSYFFSQCEAHMRFKKLH